MEMDEILYSSSTEITVENITFFFFQILATFFQAIFKKKKILLLY